MNEGEDSTPRRFAVRLHAQELKAQRELAGNDQNCPNKPTQDKIAPEKGTLTQNSARFLLPPAGAYTENPEAVGSSCIRVCA
jgi:hypothetical protein